MNTFNDLPIGQPFRCLKGEKISNSKFVNNNSVYIKVGNAAAVDAVDVGEDGTYTDCIFHLNQPVKPVAWRPRLEYIPQCYINQSI